MALLFFTSCDEDPIFGLKRGFLLYGIIDMNIFNSPQSDAEIYVEIYEGVGYSGSPIKTFTIIPGGNEVWKNILAGDYFISASVSHIPIGESISITGDCDIYLENTDYWHESNVRITFDNCESIWVDDG